MKNYYYLIFAFSLYVFSFCSEKDKKIVLKDLDSLIEQSPDSALKLLESEFPPEELDMNMHMQYFLYQTRVKDKNKLDISQDTAVFLATKYFLEKGMNDKIAYALFCSGRVNMTRKCTKKAMECFLKSTEYITGDSDKELSLLGLINYYQGYLCREQDQYDRSIQFYQKSQQFFHKARNLQYENSATIALAEVYVILNKPNLALYHCECVMKYAQKNNDSLYMSESLKNIAAIHIQNGNYQKAKEKLLSAIQIQTTTDDVILKCISLCDTYLQLDRPDSARFYLNQYEKDMMNSHSYVVKAKFHECQGRNDEVLGDYKNALENYRQFRCYFDSAQIRLEETSLGEIIEKYDFEKNKTFYNNRIKINEVVVVVAIIAQFPIGITIVLMKRKSSKMKQKLRDKEKLENEHRKKQQQIKMLLNQRFEISKKLAVINALSDSKEQKLLSKINEIIYGTAEKAFNWNEFYLLFNEIFDNLSVKLQHKYPQLNAEEVHILCLIKSGFETGEICFILAFAPITIRMKKTTIRKKLDIKDGGDLKVFMDDFLGKYSVKN